MTQPLGDATANSGPAPPTLPRPAPSASYCFSVLPLQRPYNSGLTLWPSLLPQDLLSKLPPQGTSSLRPADHLLLLGSFPGTTSLDCL